VTVGLYEWWLLDHGNVGCASTVAGIQLNLFITHTSIDVEQGGDGHWSAAFFLECSWNADWAALSFNVLQLFSFETVDVA
jgi:hypothetical protein